MHLSNKQNAMKQFLFLGMLIGAAFGVPQVVRRPQELSRYSTSDQFENERTSLDDQNNDQNQSHDETEHVTDNALKTNDRITEDTDTQQRPAYNPQAAKERRRLANLKRRLFGQENNTEALADDSKHEKELNDRYNSPGVHHKKPEDSADINVKRSESTSERNSNTPIKYHSLAIHGHDEPQLTSSETLKDAKNTYRRRFHVTANSAASDISEKDVDALSEDVERGDEPSTGAPIKLRRPINQHQTQNDQRITVSATANRNQEQENEGSEDISRNSDLALKQRLRRYRQQQQAGELGVANREPLTDSPLPSQVRS